MRKNELMYWHERIPLEDISWGNLTFLIFRDYDQSGGMELSRCKDPLVTKETSFWQMAKLKGQQHAFFF